MQWSTWPTVFNVLQMFVHWSAKVPELTQKKYNKQQRILFFNGMLGASTPLNAHIVWSWVCMMGSWAVNE